MNEILDRRLPCDIDAETAIIGSLLLWPDCWDDVSMAVSAEDFYDTANQLLFEHIAGLRDANKPLDVTLLVSRLKAAGAFETAGGAAHIAKASQSVATPGNAVYYARLVREHAIRRQAIEASAGVTFDAYGLSEPAESLISTATGRFAEIGERMLPKRSAGGSIKEIMHRAIDAIDARSKGGVDRHGSGLCGIDRIIGGFKRGQLVVIGARPSQGKTSLLLRFAQHMSREAGGLNTLFVTLEMSEAELGERMLSMVAKVNSWKMASNRMSTSERQGIGDAAACISRLNLFVEDPGTCTASQIDTFCRSYSRRCGGLDVLAVDYVQLIEAERGGSKNESRQQQIGKITRKLKRIAKDQDLIVLTAAQVGRDADKASRMPRLSDLREAGDIENDADVVIMCHMPGAEDEKKRPTMSEDGEEAKLLIRKNRNGPTGEVDMYYFRAYSLWGDTAANEDSSQAPPQPRYSEFDDYNKEAGGDEYGTF